MTKQERLIIYKQALKDYKRANSWYRFLFNLPIYDGFCWYFIDKHKIYMIDLPELLKQNPNNFYSAWWFPKGELEPRIKCLEEAIKLAEK